MNYLQFMAEDVNASFLQVITKQQQAMDHFGSVEGNNTKFSADGPTNRTIDKNHED